MQNSQVNIIFASKLHSPQLKNLGTLAGHFQHLFKGNPIQAARILNHPGVGGVDTVHIGINLALIGFQSRRQGHRRGIRAATAERGDITLVITALKTSDHDHSSLAQIVQNALGANVGDSSLSVNVIGDDSNLAAGIGNGRTATFDQRHA